MLMMTASLLLKMVEPGGATELVVAVVEAEMVSGGPKRGASSWRGCRGCPSLHCR